jgi:enterochelin esterase-like enzyme
VEHSRILHGAIQAKQLPPIIMVFPCGGRGTLYYDSPDGTIMAETATIKELIPLVDGNYRTIADRGARAIEGFSMGGFGALKLGFKYPELFCSIVSGAPAIVDWERASSLPVRKNYPRDFTKRMWDDDRGFFESDHAYAWLDRNSGVIRRELRIRIVVGDQDRLKGLIDRFHDRMEELGIPHEYEVLEGIGHNRVQVYDMAGLKGLRFHAASFAMMQDSGKS